MTLDITETTSESAKVQNKRPTDKKRRWSAMFWKKRAEAKKVGRYLVRWMTTLRLTVDAVFNRRKMMAANSKNHPKVP